MTCCMLERRARIGYSLYLRQAKIKDLIYVQQGREAFLLIKSESAPLLFHMLLPLDTRQVHYVKLTLHCSWRETHVRFGGIFRNCVSILVIQTARSQCKLVVEAQNQRAVSLLTAVIENPEVAMWRRHRNWKLSPGFCTPRHAPQDRKMN